MADKGDSGRTLIAYTLEYSQDDRSYSVSRIDGFKATSAMRELWETGVVDASAFVRPSNPRTLLKSVQEAAKVDLDLDSIFGPAIKEWDSKGALDAPTSLRRAWNACEKELEKIVAEARLAA